MFLIVLQLFSIYSLRVSMKPKLPLQLSSGIIQRNTVLKSNWAEATCLQKRNAQLTAQSPWLGRTSLNALEGNGGV